eukprot:maker-scaffold487_size158652-snap-gene-0.46 protein:Tk00170 transcript:maker-scaffold487_size158652-snap-gene-0.46-mRNA-1 annotation:"hypothetical protein CAPTEDRAFT_141957"
MSDLEFSWVDYVVFAAMLVASFGIGIYHAIKSSGNNEEYLMGGHSIGVLPMAISLCASFNSAYMILGIPSEMYTYGTQFFLMIFGTGIGVVLAAELWIPVLYRLRLVSIYEYFELRYKSKFPRLLMTFIFILKTILYTALVVYAPTIALSSVSSLSWWVCILVLGISSTLYTTLGGMKAIVWTDVFQIFIMFGGILTILIRGLAATGGLENVWRTAELGGRIEFFNFSADPFQRHTFWNVLFGTIILWGSPYVCSQYLVHRCICLESEFKGKMALYINYVGQVTMVTLVSIIGLVLYTYYLECDPVLAGVVAKRDAVIPLFVLQEFANYYGVPGLFISCLFSGALSTLDSALHAMAAVTWEEIKGLNMFKKINDAQETRITKGLSMGYGIIATGLAFLCRNIGSLISLGGTLFGACMGPMFAFFLISVTLPFVNLKGTCTGLIISQIANIILSIGAVAYGKAAPKLTIQVSNCSMFGMASDFELSNGTIGGSLSSEPEAEENPFLILFQLSYNLYPIIGFLLTVILSISLSLLFGGDKDLTQADEHYFIPGAWRMYSRIRTIPKAPMPMSPEAEELPLDKVG